MSLHEMIPTTTGSGADVERNIPLVAKRLMGFKGMTAREMAEVLHMHPNRFSERMRGISRFTIAEVVDMANRLEVDPTLFFYDPAELDQRVQNWKKTAGRDTPLTVVPGGAAPRLPGYDWRRTEDRRPPLAAVASD